MNQNETQTTAKVDKINKATQAAKAAKAAKAVGLTKAAPNAAQATKAIPRIDQEFKSLIPPITVEEREQLEQNIIAKRKCHDAIVVWEGVILDGHNRFEICVKHGVEFEVKEIKLPSRDEAKIWILNNQLGRRNLNAAMRIELVLLKEDVMRAKARKNLSDAGKKGRPGESVLYGENQGVKEGEMLGEKPLSKMEKPQIPGFHVRQEQAREANVSEGTLYNYTQLKQHASPELLEKVQAGLIKIGTAHRMLGKEILKQLSESDKMCKYMVNALPPAGLMATNPELHREMAALHETLCQLIAVIAAKNGVILRSDKQNTRLRKYYKQHEQSQPKEENP